MLKLPAPRSLPDPRSFSEVDGGGGPNPLIVLKLLLRTALLFVIFLYLLTLGTSTNAVVCRDYFSCSAEIERVKKEISRLQGEQKTLTNQIAYLDNQIYLTELEIQAKQQEINILSADISDLTVRLDRIEGFLVYQEKIFANRARLAYASDRLSSFDIILGAESLEEALRRIKYLRVLEDQDLQSLNEMRNTRTNFSDQKTVLEGKKSEVERLKREVERHKANLISQQDSKKQLLEKTRGEEARYQQMLKYLEAERAAIIAALRSKGFRLGPVNKGDQIAIQGSTGCSTGDHIHYSVYADSNPSREVVGRLTELNPCNYVRVVGGTCDSGSYFSSGGYVYSGSFRAPGAEGSWLSQSYWGSRYYGHRALDVVSSDGRVYASSAGVASVVTDAPSFAAVCRSRGYPYNGLGYGIRIDHGNIVTSYWHIRKPPGF